MNITIKNYRSFVGREGYGFNADFYFDGRKAGMIIDSAHGGPYQYDLSAADMKLLEAAAKKAGKLCKYTGCDLFVSELIDAHELQTKLKRWLKADVVFNLPGDGPGVYHKVRHNGRVAEAEAWVTKKYPQATFVRL